MTLDEMDRLTLDELYNIESKLCKDYKALNNILLNLELVIDSKKDSLREQMRWEANHENIRTASLFNQ